MDRVSIDSIEAAMAAYSEISTKILHILTSALVVFPLLFTVSFWPLIMNPRNPFWMTAHLVFCEVYAVMRLMTILASMYSVVRMKRPSFLAAYVTITWIGVFLDGIGIVAGLTLLEYPDSTVSSGIIHAYGDRYLIQSYGYSKLCFHAGIGCLLFYLLQLVLDLASIFIANKAYKQIRNKPVLVFPADESFELQMQIRVQQTEIHV